MLNAKTNRERLGFNVYAFVVQHLEGITGTVANRQHNMAAVQLLAAG